MILTYDSDNRGQSGTHAWIERPDRPVHPIPGRHLIDRWLAAARTPGRRLALRRERGLGLPADVGWDSVMGCWVLLIRDRSGEIVNVEYKPPRGEGKPWRITGRVLANGGLPLYPRLPEGDAWVLCAGTWDVHAALQAGLPAVTGLSGAKWCDAWNADVKDKKVAVVYDTDDPPDAACNAVDKLLVAGAIAWYVDLPLPGDLEDWFRPTRYGGHGRSAGELREIINTAWREVYGA